MLGNSNSGKISSHNLSNSATRCLCRPDMLPTKKHLWKDLVSAIRFSLSAPQLRRYIYKLLSFIQKRCNILRNPRSKKTSGSSKHRSQSTRRQYKIQNNLAQSQINTSGRSRSKAGGRLLLASVHLYSGTRSRRRSWFALLSTTRLLPDEQIQTTNKQTDTSNNMTEREGAI